MTSQEAEYHIGCLESLRTAQDRYIDQLKATIAGQKDLIGSLQDLNNTSDELIAALSAQRNKLIAFLYTFLADVTDMEVLPESYQRVVETMILELQMLSPGE